MFVFGTRPEAIKMAPVIKEFEKNLKYFKLFICVTGQHRQMLDQILELFNITPDYDLDIMKQGQDLYDITSDVLLGMKDIISEVKPDILLVHGDTTTSFAASLAAFYQQVPVGHVEAGLRTNNIYSPWPEEMNRQITSRIATYHFAPTTLSKNNLIKEGVLHNMICVTGNTVIDSLYTVLDNINRNSDTKNKIFNILIGAGIEKANIDNWLFPELNKEKRRLVLITGHRRENFGEGFHNICKAIMDLSDKYSNVDFVYPMHLNPNVRKPILDIFGSNYAEKHKNVFFIEPLDYLPFVFMINCSSIILTDSGGIQEEAPSLGKPVLVMRDTTERPEAVNAGTVKLIGTNYNDIMLNVSMLLDNEKNYELMAKASNPYGDGMASKRIVDFLMIN